MIGTLSPNSTPDKRQVLNGEWGKIVWFLWGCCLGLSLLGRAVGPRIFWLARFPGRCPGLS